MKVKVMLAELTQKAITMTFYIFTMEADSIPFSLKWKSYKNAVEFHMKRCMKDATI